MSFVAGLDLGQRSDYSALVIARHTDRLYEVVVARRWRGTAYTELVQRVSALVSDPLFNGQMYLRIDSTGVGVAVMDLFEQARSRGTLKVAELEAITFSSGVEPNPQKGTWPKRDLLERVRILLEQKNLVFSAKLALTRTIQSEIKNYGYKISPSGRDTYDATKGHDDLVTALALAVHDDPGVIVFSTQGSDYDEWEIPAPIPPTQVHIGREPGDPRPIFD